MNRGGEIITPPQIIINHRNNRFRLLDPLRIKDLSEAVEFINTNGFISFWPIKGILLPSLWGAAAGDRPVPDQHDDPGHITWDWKDALLGKKRVYYGRVLRRRNIFISLETLPYFYALSPNYGDPDQDYLDQYEQGSLTLESKQIYEALLRQGPLDTLALRRVSHLTGSASDTRFSRALDDLQRELKVIATGISQVGAWHYAFIYDIITRQFPDLPSRARSISEVSARQQLILQYIEMVGACEERDLIRLFGWDAERLKSDLAALSGEGHLVVGVHLDGLKGEWLGLKHILPGGPG
jgi:hypothetical protein